MSFKSTVAYQLHIYNTLFPFAGTLTEASMTGCASECENQGSAQEKVSEVKDVSH